MTDESAIIASLSDAELLLWFDRWVDVPAGMIRRVARLLVQRSHAVASDKPRLDSTPPARRELVCRPKPAAPRRNRKQPKRKYIKPYYRQEAA